MTGKQLGSELVLKWWHVIGWVISMALASVLAFGKLQADVMTITAKVEAHETTQIEATKEQNRRLETIERDIKELLQRPQK